MRILHPRLHRCQQSVALANAVSLNIETAGNLLYGGFKLLADDPGEENYQLLGVDFAQYVKWPIIAICHT